MIESRNISVVVQGEISPFTYSCLSSVRKCLPNAEIILSTWKDCEIEELKNLYDVLVLSDDPGGFPANKEDQTIFNNINRQLISTQSGIKYATRNYVLKLRSDILLKSSKFLKSYDKYNSSSELFKERLLIVEYYTRNPRVLPMPFHPSDWILFGNRDDVISYYRSVPLQNIKEGLWFRHHYNHADFFSYVYSLYSPEQHICLSYLKTKQKVMCRFYSDATKENIFLTERFFAKNMIIINCVQNDIIFLKYNPNRYKERCTLLTHKDWKILKRKFDGDKSLTENEYWWFFYKLSCHVRAFTYFYIRKSVVYIFTKTNLRKNVKLIINRRREKF